LKHLDYTRRVTFLHADADDFRVQNLATLSVVYAQSAVIVTSENPVETIRLLFAVVG